MANFDQLFRKYHHPLFLYARKFIADDSVALDIVQDVFTLIWEKNKYHLDDDHVQAYLFHVIRNRCFNYLKHQKIVRRHEHLRQSSMAEMEIHYYESGEKSLIRQENLDRIYEAVNSLSEINREIIELSRFDGLKNKEIAERLNIPLRTVESRIFRALNQLRQKLSDKLLLILLNWCCFKKN